MILIVPSMNFVATDMGKIANVLTEKYISNLSQSFSNWPKSTLSNFFYVKVLLWKNANTPRSNDWKTCDMSPYIEMQRWSRMCLRWLCRILVIYSIRCRLKSWLSFWLLQFRYCKKKDPVNRICPIFLKCREDQKCVFEENPGYWYLILPQKL